VGDLLLKRSRLIAGLVQPCAVTMGVGVNMLAVSFSPDLAASGNESAASEASAVDERDAFLGVRLELSDLSCSNLQLLISTRCSSSEGTRWNL
jgi:hypothetical protein